MIGVAILGQAHRLKTYNIEEQSNETSLGKTVGYLLDWEIEQYCLRKALMMLACIIFWGSQATALESAPSSLGLKPVGTVSRTNRGIPHGMY